MNRGRKVLFIDADPDMNLATVLQVPQNLSITPITQLQELIAERTGVQKDQPAPMFKMNPKVDDIPDKYCVEHNGFKLMVMGTISRGGGGCACPENAFLKSLLAYLVIAREEWVFLDMEAGIEHLGRGTAVGVDHMLVVVEPNKTSVETALRIRELTGDLKIRGLAAIGNKIMEPEEKTFLREALGDIPIIGFVGFSKEIKNLSLGRVSPLEVQSDTRLFFEGIIESLEETGSSKNSNP